MSAYQELEARFRRIAVLGEVTTILHWDAATTMPHGGADARSDQLADMKLLRHKAITDPAIGVLLDDAEASAASLSEWQSANLREMRRDYRLATALDDKLVEAVSKATSACEHAWREARAKSDFAAVLPLLQKVVDLTRETAAAYAGVFDLSPYDALVETYAPGTRSADFDPIFDDYAAFLPEFLQLVLDRQAREGQPVAPQPVPVDRQRALVEALAAATGFDFTHGRIDVSAHPFSTGYPGDQRITVSYDEQDPMFAVMAALHECGHAAYEAGLPAEWARQPVGQSLGMVVHESQSLSIEMQASRSDGFLTWLAGQATAILGDDPAYEPHNFRRLQQWVKPDFIRVDADEVTYPAHVILRTRLERAMLSGDLPLADLPGAWNEGMRALLGIEVPDDRRGCLQDIHWYDGAIGYFPTYTLGAMLAAQLAQAAAQANPEIPGALANGDFSPLMAWLRSAIHSKGCFNSSSDLIQSASGHPLNAAAFKRHLRHRYLGE
ncbi:carboxypeptidase M32 [Pacificispira sp.]|uniref:carboxypeptidase M32 n=1 Tax=Pacificispira sp. TaxID=2888761 RepID=UPI003BAC404B